MKLEFATAQEIIFARGSAERLPLLASAMGRRLLVVVGSRPERVAPIVESLRQRRLDLVTLTVKSEPTTAMAREGVAMGRAQRCDVVVAIGGGSVVDAGKAIAALLGNDGDPLDYLEVIGAGRKLDRPSLPFIAVPTTAGTGSEVTRNAVLASPEHQVKASLRSLHMLPRLALVDPALTDSMPKSVTASCGLDALTQLFEPFISLRRQPLVDAICREAIPRAARALPRAYENGADASARDDMAFASLCGGLALANAGLGAVHGLAGPLGGMFDAPHGAVCARLLSFAIAVNEKALRERDPDNPARARLDEAAKLMTGSASARAADGAAWVRDLTSALAVPTLAAYGVNAASLADIAAKAAVASSMQANPIKLTHGEIVEVLARAL